MTDQEAHAIILQRCRATGIGRWVMRKHGGRCYVQDLGWNREPRIAEGGNWVEVLDKLPEYDGSC
jgi:hypothetical protein